MTRLISALIAPPAVFTLFTAAAMAEPVGLVCNGEIERFQPYESSRAFKGGSIAIDDTKVSIAGMSPFDRTYNVYEANGAEISFTNGGWGGSLNRYSGKLSVFLVDDRIVQLTLDGVCTKTDPLF